MYIKKFFGHLHTVNKHRWYVFKLSIKAGIPLRGLVHDLSKYSPVEFFEGVKYYNGSRSPIKVCKDDIGYSKAWLHHKGRNKHHFEYWYDFWAPVNSAPMPFKYFCELICDNLAAGMAYRKKEWNKKEPLEYFLGRKDKEYINHNIEKSIIEVYEMLAKEGINKTITHSNLKRIYNKNCS